MNTKKSNNMEQTKKGEKILTELQNPWTIKPEKIREILRVDLEKGLTKKEVRKQKRLFGSNEIKKVEKTSIWQILFNQFKSLLVAFLIIASILSFVFEEYIDGIAIAIVIFINSGVGFFTEYRAERAIESLYELTKIKTNVRRNGEIKEISAQKIVIGDIVVLKTGDIVPADARITTLTNLKVDESSLTGESVPVAKKDQVLEKVTPLAERENMIYKGTVITRGSCEGVVVAIGEDTEIGKISSLVKKTSKGETPLTRRLSKLGRRLLWLTLVIAAIIFGVGLLRGGEIIHLIESSTALAVATVPEGLPIVATIALARGMWRMAEKNAIINKLSAVEALGSTNIICVDKTGTLTENQMTGTKIILHEKEIKVTGRGLSTQGEFKINGENQDIKNIPALKKIIQTGVFCNKAELQERKEKDHAYEGFGDPIEVALLVLGGKAGIWKQKLEEKYPQEKLEPFNVDIKMMGAINKYDDRFFVSVKGAPKAVLEASESVITKDGKKELKEATRSNFRSINEKLAKEGLRILGFAYKETNTKDIEIFGKLTFLGLIAFLDPPREEVKPAILKCKQAGIRVIMVTGDQVATAENIAKRVGLVENSPKTMHGSDIEKLADKDEKIKEQVKETDIFARFTPEQKLELIDLYQAENLVIAMTGDGVNDSPALEKANIGVAMGKRGTQVAKEASDLIIKDDDFQTITLAVEEGRVIANNIKKFAMYLLSCNFNEIILIFILTLLQLPIITPLQILYLNLITDIFPALALAVGRGGKNIMDRDPRPADESIITLNNWLFIGIFGAILTAPTLSIFLILNGFTNYPEEFILTITFLVLGFAQLWHVFNLRSKGSKFFKNEITTNKYMWGGIVLSIILLLAGTYIPGLNDILHITNPGFYGWLMIIGMSLLPLIIGQLWIAFGNNLINKIKLLKAKLISEKNKNKKG
ncbi:MAG: HAD-IC family P-type ATPase [Asgard group archaeon]|nr:HAD-IC family P-type ATPase [Asgard group archaeon]